MAVAESKYEQKINLKSSRVINDAKSTFFVLLRDKKVISWYLTWFRNWADSVKVRNSIVGNRRDSLVQ